MNPDSGLLDPSLPELPGLDQPEEPAAAASAAPSAANDVPVEKTDRAELKQDRLRHYNREAIRKYMADQKKKRKEHQSADDRQETFVCNHTRSGIRIDTGIKP